MTTSTRKVQKLTNNSWMDLPFEVFRPGDIYRLFESTGEPVVDSDENKSTTIFKVMGQPFLNANNVWGNPRRVYI